MKKSVLFVNYFKCMKNCFLLLVLNFLFLFSVSAQQNQGTTTNESAAKKTAQQKQRTASDESAVKKTTQQNAQQNRKDSVKNENALRKNFFVGAGIKRSVYVNDNARDFEIWKKPTLAGTIMAGKWFNPYLGSRIVLEAGQLNPYFQKGTFKEEEVYFSGRLDLLFDLTNCFRTYSPYRFYHLMPYMGIGGESSFSAKNRPDYARHSASFLFGGGLWNTFRLSKKLSAYLNVGIDLINANSDGWKDKRNVNGIAGASTGVLLDF